MKYEANAGPPKGDHPIDRAISTLPLPQYLIAPPVAAESVDTEEFREVLNAVVMCKSIMQIQCNALLLEHIDVWGAQQREQGKAEQTAFLKECMDRGQAEFNRKWAEQKDRAEKAEAELSSAKRQVLELQRTYAERGLQIERLETALTRIGPFNLTVD